jgi:phage recombination protein Bet
VTGTAIELASTLTDEQVRLIKDTIIPGASDDELALFVNQANRTRLDPFAKQIYSIKRYSSVTHSQVYQVQISIDGARLVAQRSGEYAGQTPTYWCGADGIWVDVWLQDVPPKAAKVGVYRNGFVEALTAVALWDQYAVKDKDGKLTTMWKKMGSLMLGKCAEMLALRRAFPMELSGLYSTEEMDQAGGEVAAAGDLKESRPIADGADVSTSSTSAAAKPASRRRAAPRVADKPNVSPTDTFVVPPTQTETLKAQGQMTPDGPANHPRPEPGSLDDPTAGYAPNQGPASEALVRAAFPEAEDITDAELIDPETGEVLQNTPDTVAVVVHEPLPLKQRNLVRRLLAEAGHPEDMPFLREISLHATLKTPHDLTEQEFERVVTILQKEV